MPKTYVSKCSCCEGRVLFLERSFPTPVEGDFLCVDMSLENLALLSYQIQDHLTNSQWMTTASAEN